MGEGKEVIELWLCHGGNNIKDVLDVYNNIEVVVYVVRCPAL